jgi:flagellar hook-associated protein 3 FlgL
MVSSLDAAANSFLNHLSRLQSTINTVTAQLSSAHCISQPSDAPDQISPLLALQASLSHNEAVSTTIARVKAEVSTADSGVSTAIQLLDQALSLGAQGASGTATDATRSDLAQQVQAIQEQLVAVANTRVAGRYIYSGDQDTARPYALNLNQPATDPQNGVDRLLKIPVTASRRIEISSQVTMTIDQSAQALFDHRNADDTLATDNVFAALNKLRAALAGNNTASIKTAQTSVETASAYLNSKQGFYATVLTRITSATTELNAGKTNLEQQISAIRDTDMVQAALELSAATAQSQAALAAQAKLPRNTLFDFFG